jgi:chromosome segregation ATPase
LQAFKDLNTSSDHDNTLSNSPGEILELKSIIEDFRHREVKLESELLHMKDKENKFVELERRLLGRNAELMAIIEGFKEREAQHQVELLQYYGLKEQENNCRDLESQLLRKDGELKKFSGLLGSLQEQNNKIVRDLQGKECVIKELGVATDKIKDLQSNQECLKGELDIAQDKIKDLQMTLQTQANQSKEQLLFLRQQVSELEEREHNASEKCLEMGRKLKKLKECEAIAARLTKKCNFLEQEKHELTVQLDTVEAKLSELSSVMEVYSFGYLFRTFYFYLNQRLNFNVLICL